jgi:hypothetical protein
MYPRLSEWKRVRDEMDPMSHMQSNLSRRLGLTTATTDRGAA